MSDKILVEYQVATAGLQAGAKVIQNELRATEAVGVQAANNTTKAFKNTADQAETLSDRLGGLQEKLSKATNPKEVEKLNKELKILNSQISAASGTFVKAFDNTKIVSFNKETAKLAKDLKGGEEGAGKLGKKVVDEVGKKGEKAIESLRAQLKRLNIELINATDPAEAERLAKTIGELKDKIGDAADAAKSFSSDSKFVQIGTTFKNIFSKVFTGDFGDALAQSKLLLSISKSLTFKDAVSGVKDLGGTLLNVGKSLLANPLFLIGTAITLVVANFDKLKSSGGAVGALFTGIGNVISFVTEGFTKLTDAIGLTAIATEKQTQAMLEAINKQIESITNYYDKRIALDNAFGRDSVENEKSKNRKIIIEANKGIQALADIQKHHIEDYIKKDFRAGTSVRAQRLVAGRAFTEDEQKKFDELQKIITDAQTNIELITAKSETKKLDEQKKINDELIKEAEALAKLLRDLQTNNIRYDYERKRQQILNNFDDEAAKHKNHAAVLHELEIKKNNELNDLAAEREWKYQKILQESRDKSIEIFKNSAKEMIAEDVGLSQKFINNQKKITEEEKKQIEIRKQLQSEFSNFLSSTVQATAEISNNIAQAQLQETQEKSNAETEAIKKQYEQGIISKDEYEKRKAEIDKRTQAEEARIKKKQFETNKQLALIQVAISTAQAIAKTASELGYPAALPFIALAAANAALQIAAIESQPTPKFEKGGKVGGKRHSQGGTIIEAEKDEFVVRRSESIKNDRLLTAINKGQAAKFIKEFYIAPALKAQKRKHQSEKELSFADSLVKSMSLNPSFNDSGILEGLKMNRKNDREIAHFIVKELKGNQRSSHKW